MKPEDVDELTDAVVGALGQLGKVVLDARTPKPGLYAFFHHQSHAIERARDVRLVLHRMLRGRSELSEVLAEPHYDNGEETPRFQELMAKEHELSSHLKLDFESLYLFGHLLLEQWSLVAGRVVGVDVGERGEGAFTAVYRRLEAGSEPALRTIWASNQEVLIWLFWQLRFYRNRFITHANRPWQRGSNYSHVGSDFTLFVPSPPGWVDFDIDVRVAEVWDRLPETITGDVRGDAVPAERLRVMRDRMGTIADRQLREDIGALHRDLGGSTPTFQVVGQHLLVFVAASTSQLTSIASADPNRVLLGVGARLDRLPNPFDDGED